MQSDNSEDSIQVENYQQFSDTESDPIGDLNSYIPKIFDAPKKTPRQLDLSNLNEESRLNLYSAREVADQMLNEGLSEGMAEEQKLSDMTALATMKKSKGTSNGIFKKEDSNTIDI